MNIDVETWEEAVHEIRFVFRKYAEGNTNYTVTFPNGSTVNWENVESFCNEYLPTNEDEAESRALAFLELYEVDIRKDLKKG